jgi:phage-related protein (TIGR01555 family)
MGTKNDAAMVKHADAWTNIYNGLGDPDRDPATATRPLTVTPFSQTELDILFNDDHLAYKICTALPSDALRAWCTLKIDDDAEGKGDEILEFVEDIGARAALQEGLVWARQSGGCLLVLGVDDGGAADQPLNEEAIRSFSFVNVIRPDRAQVATYYTDPTQPKFSMPQTWRIHSGIGGAASGVLVHETRVVWLRGELATPERRKANQGWDNSSLQRAKEPLKRNAMAWHSLATLLTKSNLMVFGVKGFSTMVKQLKEALVAFTNRMQLSKMAMSVNGWLTKDADGETVENVTVNFGGIPEAMDRLMMEAASAADMPVTKLWGRSPAGMNATGESDLQLWEQQVEAYQVQYVKGPLEQMVRLAMLVPGSATGGAEPDSWAINFAPLRVMTDAQVAAVQLQQAQAVSILITSEVCTPEEVALGELFGDDGMMVGLAAVDTDARRVMLEAELTRMQEQAKNPPPPPPQFGFGGAPPKPANDDEPGDDDKPEPDAA